MWRPSAAAAVSSSLKPQGQLEPNWVGMFIVYVFCCWSEVHKRHKRPKGVKMGVSIYMGIILYCSFVFMKTFLMHSLRKSLSETFIMLCNYYCFWHKRVGGGVEIFFFFWHIWKVLRYIEFLFLIQLWCIFVVVWIVLSALSSMSTDFLYQRPLFVLLKFYFNGLQLDIRRSYVKMNIIIFRKI